MYKFNGSKLCMFPKSVTKIDDLAFRECKELRTVITKGNNVQIHDGSFHWCRNLSTILVEPSAEIGESYDCPLKELMYLSWINNPDELEALGWNVIVIWECELKKGVFETTMQRVENELFACLPLCPPPNAASIKPTLKVNP